jgi:hypothetical protein
MTEIFGRIGMIGTWRITPLINSNLRCHALQLAFTVTFASVTLKWVISYNKLKDIAAQTHNFFRVS